MTRVLVIEEDDSRRQRLREEFERNGFGVVEAPHADAVIMDNAQADTVVANTSFAASSNIVAMAAPVPVVLLADSPSIPEAVECMRRGAADYLPRPFQPNALIAAVERAVATTDVPADSSAFSPIVGQCDEMQDLLDRVASVAPTGSSILILGESGTGKELIARALHTASLRRHAQVITFNCAAIPETLIEVELFGSDSPSRSATEDATTATRRGLLEAAHGGTLFLDEIGDLPASAQARLVHYLTEGTFRRLGGSETHRIDVRVIAATHRDLRQLTKNGQFREDLFARLNAVSLRVPPLRDRGDDVVAIAQTTLERLADKFNKRGLALSADAIEAMQRYRWPGNVRELENALERAVILCQATTINADMLPIHADASRAAQADAQRESSSSLEGYFLRFVLDNEDHLTETELAKSLGISRKSLWERRQRLNIPRRRTHKRGPRR